LAFQYEKEYHYCLQCTVVALQEVLQIKNDVIFLASFAFGGHVDKCPGVVAKVAKK